MDFEPTPEPHRPHDLEPSQAPIPKPPVVESESATTDHEHNHTGAAPVIVSLVIVCALALLSFAFTSFTASFMEPALRSQWNNNSTLYQWDIGGNDLDDLWSYDGFY